MKILLLLFCVKAWAITPFELLQGAAGDSLRKTSTGFSYCPDETCDVFKFAPSSDAKMIEDFMVLYYGLVPSYIHLDEFKTKHKVHIEAVAKRYACKDLPKCALKTLKGKLKPTIFSERSDEGKTIVSTSQSLEDFLAPAKPRIKK